jgi:NAD(P)-dependent dehydrogenase (short-subunit alcohol dehydrogenase family)
MDQNITGKNVFMTGATSGFGKIVAMHIADLGANVTVLARDNSKSETLNIEYQKKNPDGKGSIEFVEGNLNSFSSVASACEKVKSKVKYLDIIVHNAGIMNFNPVLSVDGIEETLQVNLLAPMLINHLLFPLFDNTKNNKVIYTASGLHQGDINFNNIEFKNNFNGFRVYRQSKLGVILMCRLLDNKLNSNNINFYSNHPGLIRTDLGRSAGLFAKFIFWAMGKSPEKGAQTLIYLLENDKNVLRGGEYYAYKQVKKITPQSYNLETAEKLLTVIKEYLKSCLNEPSLIFPQNEKNI